LLSAMDNEIDIETTAQMLLYQLSISSGALPR